MVRFLALIQLFLIAVTAWGDTEFRSETGLPQGALPGRVQVTALQARWTALRGTERGAEVSLRLKLDGRSRSVNLSSKWASVLETRATEQGIERLVQAEILLAQDLAPGLCLRRHKAQLTILAWVAEDGVPSDLSDAQVLGLESFTPNSCEERERVIHFEYARIELPST